MRRTRVSVDSTVGLELPLERRVRADATQAISLTDNEGVRLIRVKRPREVSLREGECYDHSYGEHVSDHVQVVNLEPRGCGSRSLWRSRQNTTSRPSA